MFAILVFDYYLVLDNSLNFDYGLGLDNGLVFDYGLVFDTDLLFDALDCYRFLRVTDYLWIDSRFYLSFYNYPLVVAAALIPPIAAPIAIDSPTPL